nr:hypothetical protein [Tanacetum cinerariifolium]
MQISRMAGCQRSNSCDLNCKKCTSFLPKDDCPVILLCRMLNVSAISLACNLVVSPGLYVPGMKRDFLSQKEGGGGRGGPTFEKAIAFGNNNDTRDGNVGQCLTPINSIAAPNEGNVLINVADSPTTPSNSGSMLSGPTSYAKLVSYKPSRKSVNFHTLVAPAGNEAELAISVESFLGKGFLKLMYYSKK